MRQNRRGKKGYRERPTTQVLAVIAIILAIALFFGIKTAFHYLTENTHDPDNPYPVKGIDVSVYQGDIDWEGLKTQGVEFAFIKATEGSTYVDSNFEKNWKESFDAGVYAGAYHFLSFDSDGQQQAENFINTVNWKLGMLPPVVDVELYGRYLDEMPSAEQLHTRLDTVLEAMEKKYRKKPIIYTNKHIYRTYISGRYEDYDIWISDHNVEPLLEDGREWTFCQYTFNGISQYVSDGNKYIDFNIFRGNEWEFRKYR